MRPTADAVGAGARGARQTLRPQLKRDSLGRWLDCMTSAIFTLILIFLSVTSRDQEQAVTLSSSGVGALRFCDPLSRVDSLWSHVQDTTISSEEVGWPAKIVRLASGGAILFESSWADEFHVWRISTDVRIAQTPGGVRVGMTLQQLIDRGMRPSIKLPEGILVLALGAEGVAVTVDSLSAARFRSSGDRTIGGVPRDATVARLIATGPGCKQGQRPN